MGATPTAQYLLRIGALQKQALPLLVEPDALERDPHAAFAAIEDCVQAQLEQVGAILFRGFDFSSADSFHRFAAAFGAPLLSYEFGSTPRRALGKGVYTSTEYPAHQRIPLHNEQSYTRRWPLRIWFHCPLPAAEGGETPIADSRAIYRLVDPAIRQRFEQRGLMYVRNSGNGLDVPWQQVFGTDQRSVVQAYCQQHGIACEWKEDGQLRTRQVCQATARHPATGEAVWFNQAHLFHVSGLDPQLRETLMQVVEPEDLPRNVYYGDGSDIEDSVLDEIRGVLDDQTISFPWQRDDVLMLDNMLVAHARSTFKGPRKVVVAMAREHGA
ncbi:TauD/TfdA family dioxygenase [Herbaspirillum rubrisubalbicans]|uniref:TauD/TfdA family dioxygenase n=1 Tax=Herbaspirillum rubrisubalbicans TaxID=80842 RepID=UPI0035714737